MEQFAEIRARWCLGKFERIHCLLEIKILPIFLTDNSGFRILVLIITSNVGFFFLLERTLLILDDRFWIDRLRIYLRIPENIGAPSNYYVPILVFLNCNSICNRAFDSLDDYSASNFDRSFNYLRDLETRS